MKLLKIHTYFLFLAIISCLLPSCVDDQLVYNPDEIDPNIPKELVDGYSVSFSVNLDGMGTETFSLNDVTKNAYLREIENFVDLEKLRILFFTCTESGDNTGKYDFFLFESKSRWVSTLTDFETTQAKWQVTAPVFTYGNNDKYDWEAIRYALEKHPFKIVILANRPDNMNFGDFDGKFGKDIIFETDRGPNWGPADTYIYNELVPGKDYTWRDLEKRNKQEDFNYSGVNFNKKPTINGLHHCQWDPIYSSKNNGKHVYDFIIEKPYAEEGFDYTNDKLKDKVTLYDQGKNSQYNLMGALSFWTEKEQRKDDKGNLMFDSSNKPIWVKDTFPETAESSWKDANFYFHPNKTRGIPMYGVQVFEPLTDWKAGTPYNVSMKLSGQNDQYERKNINLLRSVAKIELKIPKVMYKEDGSSQKLEITEPRIHYTNVMARCEPLDVATPTELIWKTDDPIFSGDPTQRCEWNNIMAYGPIINSDQNGGNQYKGSENDVQNGVNYFHSRVAWFYGAWKDWWHFNGAVNQNDLTGPETSGGYNGARVMGYDRTKFEDNPALPYPRIFNPVIQRNGDAKLDKCKIEDLDFNYFVIYTGEKNINDPSTVTRFSLSTAEMIYFSFKINGTKYYVPLTDYSTNTLVDNEYFTGTKTMTTYKTNMPTAGPGSYSWALLRNHVYTVTITSFKDFLDLGAVNSQIVSTEIRTAPTYEYY